MVSECRHAVAIPRLRHPRMVGGDRLVPDGQEAVVPVGCSSSAREPVVQFAELASFDTGDRVSGMPRSRAIPCALAIAALHPRQGRFRGLPLRGVQRRTRDRMRYRYARDRERR